MGRARKRTGAQTRRRVKQNKKTTIRASLQATSSLQSDVEDGLEALEKNHRKYLDTAVRACFDDSLDLDKAMESGHEQENRWDHLLGHASSASVVGLEPHSARQDQISTVIAKKTAAKRQLAEHLKPGARVAAWLWVASGRTLFADTEKARLRLDQAGIRFVGGEVLPKHLPDAQAASKKPQRK